MILTINIPDEFVQDFKKDRFKDTLNRLSADAHLVAGNYERETAAMLIKAFQNASVEKAETKSDNVAHKYLNELGINSDETCIYNTIARETEEENNRQDYFDKERQEYGFDSRETWALNYTLISWLYSHLKMYLDVGGQVVNLKYYKFDIPVLEEIPAEERLYYDNAEYVTYKPEFIENGNYVDHFQREIIRKDVTQQECIEIACQYMEYYLKTQEWESWEKEIRADECAKCAMKIVAEIFPALWW